MKRQASVVEKVQANRSKGIYLSAISLAELEYGVTKSLPVRRQENILLLNRLLTIIPTLHFGISETAEYSRIRTYLELNKKQIGSLDTLIAAHALSQSLTLVTSNTEEFGRVPYLKIVNWL
jgi:tRNA(fMet)-specific endonuclease VapC